MNPEQLEFSTPNPAPEVTADDVTRVKTVLCGRGWQHATDICDLLGWPHKESSLRKIRAIARASGGFILSYPGSPGYRLTREATIEEIQAATALRHQADEMRERWLEIERVYHGKIKE